MYDEEGVKRLFIGELPFENASESNRHLAMVTSPRRNSESNIEINDWKNVYDTGIDYVGCGGLAGHGLKLQPIYVEVDSKKICKVAKKKRRKSTNDIIVYQTILPPIHEKDTSECRLSGDNELSISSVSLMKVNIKPKLNTNDSRPVRIFPMEETDAVHTCDTNLLSNTIMPLENMVANLEMHEKMLSSAVSAPVKGKVVSYKTFKKNIRHCSVAPLIQTSEIGSSYEEGEYGNMKRNIQHTNMSNENIPQNRYSHSHSDNSVSSSSGGGEGRQGQGKGKGKEKGQLADIDQEKPMVGSTALSSDVKTSRRGSFGQLMMSTFFGKSGHA